MNLLGFDVRSVFIFRQKPGQIDRLQYALDNDTIVIGWSNVAGLQNPKLSYENVKELLHKSYYKDRADKRAAGKAATNIWRFIRQAKIDDLIIVPFDQGVHVGEITGSVIYDASLVDEDIAYRRPVNWLTKEKPILYSAFSETVKAKLNIGRQTSKNITEITSEIMPSLSDMMKGKLWTCLLYTSPSPRDQRGSRMPSSA